MKAKELIKVMKEIGEVEFLIDETNKSSIIPLFNEFVSLGYSPVLEERNECLFFRVELQNKKTDKIIDINLRSKLINNR